MLTTTPPDNIFHTVGFIIVNQQQPPLKGFQRGFNRGAAIVFIVVPIARFNNNYIWILAMGDIYLHINEVKNELCILNPW